MARDLPTEGDMPLYSTCGILGLSPKALTKSEFRDRSYSLQNVTIDCGILGFNATPASFEDLPEDFLNCQPAQGGNPNLVYTLERGGLCVPERLSNAGNSCKPKGKPTDIAASYVTDAEGSCSFSSCKEGRISLPSVFSTSVGSSTCAPGFEHVKSSDKCSEVMNRIGVRDASSKELHSSRDPPGCFVKTTNGTPTGHYNNNSHSKGTTTDSFSVCQRKPNVHCASPGDHCYAADFKNYTWRADGQCAGTCDLEGGGCLQADRCCFGQCVDASSLSASGACPGGNAREAATKNFVHSIQHASSILKNL